MLTRQDLPVELWHEGEWFLTMFTSAFALYVLHCNKHEIIQTKPPYNWNSSYVPINLSNWNTSNVTTMQGMFGNCSSLSAPVSGWNLSTVKKPTKKN